MCACSEWDRSEGAGEPLRTLPARAELSVAWSLSSFPPSLTRKLKRETLPRFGKRKSRSDTRQCRCCRPQPHGRSPFECCACHHCCMENPPKLSGLEQQAFISSRSFQGFGTPRWLGGWPSSVPSRGCSWSIGQRCHLPGGSRAAGPSQAAVPAPPHVDPPRAA